jgi:hypothetical protein
MTFETFMPAFFFGGNPMAAKTYHQQNFGLPATVDRPLPGQSKKAPPVRVRPAYQCQCPKCGWFMFLETHEVPGEHKCSDCGIKFETALPASGLLGGLGKR